MLSELGHQSIIHHLILNLLPIFAESIRVLSHSLDGPTILSFPYLFLVFGPRRELHGLEVVLSSGPFHSIDGNGSEVEVAHEPKWVALSVKKYSLLGVDS